MIQRLSPQTPDRLTFVVKPRVELIVKRDCHLCQDAIETVSRVCEDTQNSWALLDIEDEPALAIEYAEFVPVVLVDGARHDFWRIDEARLREALRN